MNWTASGDSQNDENTLYVKNAGFAAAFQAEFDRQWADLVSVPSCTSVSAEGADSSACAPATNCTVSCMSGSCCDGIDNDYDGRVDLAEEACACADGVDNDGDGYVDTADFDCQNLVDPLSSPRRNVTYANGVLAEVTRTDFLARPRPSRPVSPSRSMPDRGIRRSPVVDARRRVRYGCSEPLTRRLR